MKRLWSHHLLHLACTSKPWMTLLYSLLPDPGTATVNPGDVEKEICHHKVESEKTKPSQTMLTGWRLFIGVELFAQDRPEASR